MQLNYKGRTCELSFSKDFCFRSETPCDYSGDTIRYAIRRYIQNSEDLCKNCTYDSWQKRLASGKQAKKPDQFHLIIPAETMEMPGVWAELVGRIDGNGLEIQSMSITSYKPSDNPRGNRQREVALLERGRNKGKSSRYVKPFW